MLSKNAIRHGLLSQAALLPDEDATAFAEFHEELMSQLDPHGILEVILVDKIAISAWRLGRVHRVEASMFAYRIAEGRARRARNEAGSLITDALAEIVAGNKAIRDKAQYESSLERARLSEVERDAEELGEAFIDDSNSGNAFIRLSRYENNIRRGMFRAMHELERLQTRRAGQAVAPPAVLDVDVSASQDPQG